MGPERVVEKMALYVSESGPKDAPSIVFVHGGGMSGWMWVEKPELYVSLVKDWIHDRPVPENELIRL